MNDDQIVKGTESLTDEQINKISEELHRKTPFFERMANRLKYLYRCGINGFPDSDTWGLFETVAKFVLPRLIRFKEVTDGYPSDMTEEEWKLILDKMIFSMDYLANDGESKVFDQYPFPDKPWEEMWEDDVGRPGYKIYAPKYNDEEEAMVNKHMEEHVRISTQVQEGLELFGKHLWSLWW